MPDKLNSRMVSGLSWNAILQIVTQALNFVIGVVLARLLTPKEFDLLVLMASHPGRSYDRQELLNLVWGYEFSGYEHTVNSHVNRLRAKLEPDVDNPKFILTTWGIGYRFNDEN